MANYCKYCGTKISNPGAKFCPKCGKQMEQDRVINNIVSQRTADINTNNNIQTAGTRINKDNSQMLQILLILVLVVVGVCIGLFYFNNYKYVSSDSVPVQKPQALSTKQLPQQHAQATIPESELAQVHPVELVVTRENATQLLYTYFSILDTKNYNKAYYMVSKARRSEFSLENFCNGYATTVSQNITVTSVQLVSNRRAIVNFDLRATDKKNGNLIYSTFRGHWDVIIEGGKLVLDNPHIWKI